MTAPVMPDHTVSPDGAVDEGPALAELHRVFAVQKAAFVADPYPSADERKGHLTSLAAMLLGHREEIRAAMG